MKKIAGVRQTATVPCAFSIGFLRQRPFQPVSSPTLTTVLFARKPRRDCTAKLTPHCVVAEIGGATQIPGVRQPQRARADANEEDRERQADGDGALRVLHRVLCCCR